jgi:hypothetical protein
MKKVDLGAVVAIPLSEGGYKLAQVIYASSYFKDVILLAFLPGISKNPELPIDIFNEYVGECIYTGSGIIRKGHWLLLGYAELPKAVPEAKRIVAGDVWLNDECIGPASETDYLDLPKMRTVGYKIIEKRIHESKF